MISFTFASNLRLKFNIKNFKNLISNNYKFILLFLFSYFQFLVSDNLTLQLNIKNVY